MNEGSARPDEAEVGVRPDEVSSLNPHGREPRRRLTLVVVAVTTLLIAAVALGAVLVANHRADVAAQQRREAAVRAEQAKVEAEAAEEAAEAEAAAEREAAELAAAKEYSQTCVSQIGRLLDSLDAIDARLNVGLSQADLADALGDAAVAYNQIDVDELGTGTCLDAAAKLETAFNRYNTTVSAWSDCIYDPACDVDSEVLPGMREKWSKATTDIGSADDLLDSLDPDSSSYDPTTALDLSV